MQGDSTTNGPPIALLGPGGSETDLQDGNLPTYSPPLSGSGKLLRRSPSSGLPVVHDGMHHLLECGVQPQGYQKASVRSHLTAAGSEQALVCSEIVSCTWPAN